MPLLSTPPLPGVPLPPPLPLHIITPTPTPSLPHTVLPLTTQLGGIVDLPDGQCHLDPVSRQYNFDARQDYPSSAYIATILNERRIIPIFAVAVGVAPMYQNLVNTIRSAFVGTFNPMSQELLALIERQYQVNHVDNRF